MDGADLAQDEDLNESILRAAQSAEADTQYAVAAAHYQKLHGKKPDDPTIILGLARNLRYIGSASEAIKLLAVSDGLKQEQPAFLLEAAKSEIAAGTPSRALAYLEKAKFLDEENWEIHATMGIAYDMADAYEKAANAYETALDRSPNNPAVLNNMAISAALSGNLTRGIEILEEAALSVRRDAQIRQNLALLYGLRGDEDKARALSQMTLDEEDVRNNLSVYSRLRSGKQHKSK